MPVDLLALLRRIEWRGLETLDGTATCPDCREDRHTDDCSLAAAIRELEAGAAERDALRAALAELVDAQNPAEPMERYRKALEQARALLGDSA